jgi:hypothetical protein
LPEAAVVVVDSTAAVEVLVVTAQALELRAVEQVQNRHLL